MEYLAHQSDHSNRKIDPFLTNTQHSPPETVRERIFEYLGREGSFAYQISSGSKEEVGREYVQKSAWFEPFTYSDWAGITAEEWGYDMNFPYSLENVTRSVAADNVSDRLRGRSQYDKHKRRLLWEREKGYRANEEWSSYPTGLQGWNLFKSAINDSNRRYVKRIAVAHWMTLNDLEWISTQLPALGALDISDVNDHLPSFMHELGHENILGKLDWDSVANALQNTLKRVTWIGVQQNEDPASQPLSVFTEVIAQCTALDTISLRGRDGYTVDYSDSQQAYSEDLHHYVCQQILHITDNLPDSVSAIELRLPILHLPLFISSLHKRKPTVQRVGIDLAAWISIYPIPNFLKAATSYNHPNIYKDISSSTQHAVQKASHCAYDNAKDAIVGKGGKWAFPSSDKDRCSVESPKVGNYPSELTEFELAQLSFWDTKFEARQYRLDQENKDFYGKGKRGARKPSKIQPENSGLIVEAASDHEKCTLNSHSSHKETRSSLGTTSVGTLSSMFNMLFQAASCSPIKVFSLQSDNTHLTRPIHPFTLIQQHDETADEEVGVVESSQARLEPFDVYKWIEETFKWRPVMDWDWFMVPRNMPGSVEPEFQRLYDKGDFMERILGQFKLMRQAGIPLHILIGRRKHGGSSCYWGWPYEHEHWNAWLKEEFDANLTQIAPLVDHLSIFYDLRNPISRERLSSIDDCEPYKAPEGVCPSVLCPWRDGDTKHSCPFKRHRETQRVARSQKPGRSQKMANKQALNRRHTGYGNLANDSAFSPATGQSAEDHPSDDSDLESNSKTSLHQLARRAVYSREAVGWQRFWKTYALRFTDLTLVQMRMPRFFDRIGSWRLAKLLSQNEGWEILNFTDERQHIQTNEDIAEFGPFSLEQIFERMPEPKQWPAGRFVRRTWIREAKKVSWKEVHTSRGKAWQMHSKKVARWPSRGFSEEDWHETEEQERMELKIAIKRADRAILNEQEAENDEIRQARKYTEQRDRRQRQQAYLSVLQKVGNLEWQCQLRAEIDRLKELMDAPTTVHPLDMRESNLVLAATMKTLEKLTKDSTPIFSPQPHHDISINTVEDVKKSLGWTEPPENRFASFDASEATPWVSEEPTSESTKKRKAKPSPNASLDGLPEDPYHNISPAKRFKRSPLPPEVPFSPSNWIIDTEKQVKTTVIDNTPVVADSPPQEVDEQAKEDNVVGSEDAVESPKSCNTNSKRPSGELFEPSSPEKDDDSDDFIIEKKGKGGRNSKRSSRQSTSAKKRKRTRGSGESSEANDLNGTRKALPRAKRKKTESTKTVKNVDNQPKSPVSRRTRSKVK